MFNLNYFSLIIFLLLNSPVFAKWEVIRTEEDVIVYEDIGYKGKMVPIKSKAIINAPFNIVLSVLANVKRKAEWAPNYVSSKTLERKDDFNRIEYNITDSPWPFSDRDFVFKTETIIDKLNKKIQIKLTSVEDFYPLQTNYVRGKILTGLITIKVAEKNKTELVLEIQVDPAGSLPTWLANYASRIFPYRFIRNLALQANKINKEKEYYLKDYYPF